MEITADLHFSVEETTLLDMHSVINVMNVIIFEVMNLSETLNDPTELSELQDMVADAADSLRDPEIAEQQVRSVATFITDFEKTVGAAISSQNMSGHPAVTASLENIRTIFDILQLRAEEIVARHRSPTAWVDHDIAKLQSNFMNVFQAIERNSKGGYRIVYNLAEHEEENYLVNFDITSQNGSTVSMPAVFQDVMRDLLANARKYTAPGGTITAGLFNSGAELRYVVSDTGVGIPPEEIQDTVQFGVRGSNVQHRPTRGGGFGLTKAYHVAKTFGGRMWIESPAVGTVGTRVEIRIPVPPATAS
ncbi:MAG: ATP-binding protein [Spirochaeta sp.]|jgi:signal transduction histidine kinase|nr:ATP-binding protein [Spirochaeta sp.]